MSKKLCFRKMESLPHDVVELILETLPVNSLLRFKAVSKQWNSTIKCRNFQERHLRQRQQSGDPDILTTTYSDVDDASLRTLVLGSSSLVKIPTQWEKENIHYFVSRSSCDGLVCLYNSRKSGFVFNPTTRWYRPLPLCELQKLMMSNLHLNILENSLYTLGFGKDKFTGTYKPVWLYNSLDLGSENATTCEVFDFTTNAWRYVTPAAPYRIIYNLNPLYVDGSLHWFTQCEETRVISFDLHTETFEVTSKVPFAKSNIFDMIMANLDNSLCISIPNRPNQEIWSFNPGNKTWDKLYSIDMNVTSSLLGQHILALRPLALLDGEKKKKKKKKKKKLLCQALGKSQPLVIHDPETKLYHTAFSGSTESYFYHVCYFQSLISI